jgi:hypothetical protein
MSSSGPARPPELDLVAVVVVVAWWRNAHGRPSSLYVRYRLPVLPLLDDEEEELELPPPPPPPPALHQKDRGFDTDTVGMLSNPLVLVVRTAMMRPWRDSDSAIIIGICVGRRREKEKVREFVFWWLHSRPAVNDAPHVSLRNANVRIDALSRSRNYYGMSYFTNCGRLLDIAKKEKAICRST